MRSSPTLNPPITPGEILLEEYLIPMGISQNAMARAIGVPPRAFNEIVLGKRSITPAMSIRLGAIFDQSPKFWHGLQVECDFRALAKDRKRLIQEPNSSPACRRELADSASSALYNFHPLNIDQYARCSGVSFGSRESLICSTN